MKHWAKWVNLSLREKCPNTEFFLICIFPHSDWIWRDTLYFSVFSLNAGKYGPEKTPYLDTFHIVSETISFSSFVKILLTTSVYISFLILNISVANLSKAHHKLFVLPRYINLRNLSWRCLIVILLVRLYNIQIKGQ